jgi:putative transposase
VAATADAYLAGVSTRRVDKLVRSLGIDGISKSQVSAIAKGLDESVEAFRARMPERGPFGPVDADQPALRGALAGVDAPIIRSANLSTRVS